MASIFNWFLLAVVSLVLLYWWISSVYNYWNVRGVPNPRPLPLFGNIKNIVLGREYTGTVFKKLYDALGGQKFGGIYLLFQPALLLKDPDTIKMFIVKDFDHFHDRGFEVDEKASPLSAHLISLSGLKWKYLRSKLTPTFSSGKMKLMFNTLAMCAVEMTRNLQVISHNQECIDMKEAVAQFTTDVIGSCAFGLHINSINNPNSRFRKMGQKVFSPSLRMYVRIFIMMCLPSWMQSLLHIFKDRELEKFFIELVRDTVKYREENRIVRNDFLQLLIQLKEQTEVKKGKTKNLVASEEQATPCSNTEDNHTNDIELTENLMAAQCLVFFMAGFETSSTTMSFCLHELAMNPGIQEKLRKEVDDVLGHYGGKLTYEAVQDMKYMDLVISETLRKYPPLSMLERVCTKRYTIPGTKIRLEEGVKVKVPVYAIHHDPKYYPDPEKFDPERFTEENKKKIPQFAYLPFGEGPRICIGMRFGLMQTKVGLAALLIKYKFSACSRTQIPLIMDAVTLVTSPKGGAWLQISDRVKTS